MIHEPTLHVASDRLPIILFIEWLGTVDHFLWAFRLKHRIAMQSPRLVGSLHKSMGRLDWFSIDLLVSSQRLSFVAI